MADVCVESIAAGGKLLMCGNGGSAADAQHLAAELLVRLRSEVDRDGIPALALALDSSSMTACGNDYSYEHFYERMTATLGQPGDVLLGLTTSGKSPNVLGALKAARAKGMKTVGFLGGDGGPALALCDVAFVVPSRETGRIQEVHITAGHALMEMIEDGLLERGAVRRRD
jgi:D-sedoheptulose 7-phosphate isomerase